MKVLFITDIHSIYPENIKHIVSSLIKKEKPDKLISLGDYDHPKILEYLLSVGLSKKILIGNHDYNFANKRDIDSKYVIKEPEFYYNLWEEHPKMKKLILDLDDDRLSKTKRMKHLIRFDKINNKRASYAHSNISAYSIEGVVSDRVWVSTGKMQDIFSFMEKKEIDLFFRGHDHFSGIFSVDKGDPYGSLTELVNPPYIFQEEKRYIISIGCFAEGVYAVLDNNSLEFKNYLK